MVELGYTIRWGAAASPRRFGRRKFTLHITGPTVGQDTGWSPDPGRAGGARRLALASIVVALVVAVALVAGAADSARLFNQVWRLVAKALWLVPGLVALHLGQLLLATIGWRCLLAHPGPRLSVYYRLRVAREGIDSLLPVAQVGGEIIGARLLARHGVALGRAAASVIADLSIELLAQLMVLLGGLALLGAGADRLAWLKLVAAAAFGAIGCCVLAWSGALRLLEMFAERIARRWPSLNGAALAGLDEAARAIFRRHRGLLLSVVLHLAAWLLGTIETWAVLHAMRVPVTVAQAFAIESLGMAARSAGFFIPAALGAQEGGFILAAAALGIAAPPALALSLVKRLREMLGGLIGLVLWRLEEGRSMVAMSRLG